MNMSESNACRASHAKSSWGELWSDAPTNHIGILSVVKYVQNAGAAKRLMVSWKVKVFCRIRPPRVGANSDTFRILGMHVGLAHGFMLTPRRRHRGAAPASRPDPAAVRKEINRQQLSSENELSV